MIGRVPRVVSLWLPVVAWAALIFVLSSVETLGETTVICTDKTGTLTENQMTAQRIWTRDGELTVEGAGYEPFGRFHADHGVIDPAPLVELLRASGTPEQRVLDVQWLTPHLASLGAVELERREYRRRLAPALPLPDAFV